MDDQLTTQNPLNQCIHEVSREVRKLSKQMDKMSKEILDLKKAFYYSTFIYVILMLISLWQLFS